MAKTDFYPNTEGGRLAFLDNFATQLAQVSAGVGLVAADVSQATAAHDDLIAAVQGKVASKAAAQAAVATAKAQDQTSEETIRALVRRIRAHPNYTESVGTRLGIIGPEGGANLAAGVDGGPRPDLAATSVLNGEVEISFQKNGFTGVEIESERGTESTYAFLARDTEAPYTDSRPNLAAGGDGPETRRYRARYLQKDTPVGEYSDVLVVTVPGKA